MIKRTCYYGGIQLQSDTSIIVIIDDDGREILRRSLPNELPIVLKAISEFSSQLQGFAVHAKANQSCLVKGLIKAGHKVFLADLTLSKKCFNLVEKNDLDDAGFFAFVLRLMTKCNLGKTSKIQRVLKSNNKLSNNRESYIHSPIATKTIIRSADNPPFAAKS